MTIGASKVPQRWRVYEGQGIRYILYKIDIPKSTTK